MVGGTYTGPNSPFVLGYAGTIWNTDPWELDGYWLATIKGDDWESENITGTLKGVGFFTSDTEGIIEADIIRGDVVGNFIDVDEPGTDTWQAVGVGEWVEVTELEENNLGFTIEDLASFVSVPITEVYTNLLEGRNSFITQATMDISIYQNELELITLWAALIEGTYTNDPTSSWALTLTEGDDSVTLNGSQWSGNEWVAGVTGSVDQYTIAGEAAGTYGDNAFVGVGAGTTATP